MRISFDAKLFCNFVACIFIVSMFMVALPFKLEMSPFASER